MCVRSGDEATFTCSVEESGGIFTWITNTTTESCRVFSPSPQSQCGQFVAQLQGSSVSTLTATSASAATLYLGNHYIQCYHNVDLVGNGTLYITECISISGISVYGYVFSYVLLECISYSFLIL